ncbi:MAG TPA: N-6 DNA methylase [Solirubrobacterales bacterium]|nr:N-6 DNA methylase [Solirubrobacterales bacterium]
MTATLTKREAKKALGAFYTPPVMAAALIDWAVRSPDDRVFDPSFGGSVFLEAALQRLSLLGANPKTTQAQVFGTDIDDEAFLQPSVGTTERATLHRGDFFGMRPGEEIPRVEAVVGNPPYIRYQEFNGSAEVAHRLAAEAGVPLTRLASSWAPFLIHGTSFVSEGGRMAQVLPAELIHAQYAAGITRFLAANFKRVAIVVFDQRVFPNALEEIVLLFAEERTIDAQGSVDLVSFSSLAELDTSKLFPDTPGGSQAPGKLLGRLLPTATRDLLAELSDRSETTELGDVAAVDIGAVTGANDFFLLSRTEARDMPRRIVRPAVSKAAQVPGTRISAVDHRRLLDEGRKGLMFVVDASSEPRSSAVQQRIAVGEEAGVPEGYKCRVRKPWWSVPLPKRGVADLLLTYFASEHPRLVLNEAGVLQTNTIHGVYLKTPMETAALAVAFYNSLTLLSAELVGRSYGGGVLKLEPTEAGSLILPPVPETLGDLLDEIDALIRDRKLEAALDLVDPIVLGEGLGLSSQEIRALRDGGAQLRARRRARGARPAPATG